MNTAKYVALVLGVVVALAAAPVFAQTYYPNYYGTASAGSCIVLTKNLSISSRDSEVSTLQNFLVAQNYPGGGSWMITGYFGKATAQAVRNFQQQTGLPVTGSVDSATRTAIQSRSCGGTYGNQYDYTYNTYPSNTYPYDYSYNTYQYNYPYTYPYSYPSYSSTVPTNYPVCDGGGNYYNCQPQSSTVYINYLNPNSGAVGSTVTVYGYGFSSEGNTVHFGNGIITDLRSYDGRLLSFTVPTQLSGYGTQSTQLTTYNVYVSDQQGRNSNVTQYTVTSLANVSIRPTLTSVSGPNTLTAGTQGTWTVSVNAPANSYVTVNVSWGDENIYNYTAQQTSQQLYVYGSQTFTFTHTYYNSGTYAPMFTASNTAGSNASSASVQVVASGSTSGQAYLNSLSPVQGQKGTLVVLNGSGFTATDNVVHFGIGGLRNVNSTNGTTIYYTIPQYVSPCDFVVGSGCMAPAIQVTSGTYPIYVTNANGTTQTLNFAVVQ